MSKLILFGAAELALDVYSGLSHDHLTIFDGDRSLQSPSDIYLADNSESNLHQFIKSFVLSGIKPVPSSELNPETDVNYLILSSSLKSQPQRSKIRHTMNKLGYREISLISRNSVVHSTIPNGCLIADGAYVGPYANLSTGNILLYNSVVSRLSTLMSDTFISANVTVTSRKSIGSCSFIGAGSTIDANIGDLCVIGSGSVVKRDLVDYSIYDNGTSFPPRIATFPNEEKAVHTRSAL